MIATERGEARGRVETFVPKDGLRYFFRDLGLDRVFAASHQGLVKSTPGFPDTMLRNEGGVALYVWKDETKERKDREKIHPQLTGADGTIYTFTGARFKEGVTTVEMQVNGLQTEYTLEELRSVRLKAEFDAVKEAKRKAVVARLWARDYIELEKI